MKPAYTLDQFTAKHNVRREGGKERTNLLYSGL